MARAKKDVSKAYHSPFAVRLRELMIAGSSTQDNLANSIGKTRQTVSQYVNGISEPSYDTLVKIADYFDISVDYILGRTPDPARVPCAADELGLSQDSIDAIKYYTEDSGDALRGLESLLISMDFWAVCLLIERLKKNIETLLVEDSPEVDIAMQHNIEEEILAAHPDLRGKIQVLYGDIAISAMADQITKLFEEALNSASGRNKLFQKRRGSQ